MTTTDSFTRCWKSAGVRRLLLLWLLALPLGWLQLVPARAESAAEITQMRLERDAEGILLYATLRVDLPPAVEEALMKGVPMVFVAEAEVMRHRWYWSDKVVASVQRHMRLAYQPLTASWRLSLGGLSQGYGSLSEAMAPLSQISGWRLVELDKLDPGSRHNVEFSFFLDNSQLPQPMQIDLGGDWKLGIERNLRVE